MKVRAILALAVASVWLVLLGPASSADAYPAAACPTLALSTSTPIPGGSVTVSGSHFAPNASVRLELRSKVSVLATVTSSASGSFSTTVTLPSGLTGHHSIAAVGGSISGAVGCPSDPVQLIDTQGPGSSPNPVPSSPGGPAFTGVDILGLVAAAAALIVTGALFNRRSSRKTAHSSRP